MGRTARGEIRARDVRLHERLDRWVRWVLFHYVAGCIIGAHTVFLLEVIHPLPLGLTGNVLVTVVLVPAIVMAVGALRLARRGGFRGAGPPPPAGDRRAATGGGARLADVAWAWRWTIAALAMFGAWAGGYMAVGWWTAGRETATVALSVDGAIPMVPEFVLFYVAVYPLVLLPFLLARDPAHFWPMVRSYGFTLAICYTIFLFFPVAFPHPPVAEVDFSSRILAVVYAGDPPTNCMPSTHCAMSLVAAVALYRVSRPLGWWAFAITLSVGVSTLFTRQHYLLDVVAGWGVALLALDLGWDGRLVAAWRRLRAQAAVARPR